MSRPAESQQPRRTGIRFDLRRALFVVPSLFTLCSIFCGFYAIVLCLERTSEGFRHAAIAIFVGMLLDLFDGRVARLTRTQSEFGRQLDSLADLVSFGTAPTVLVYAWGLHRFGLTGLVLAFAYTACAATRLARFNYLAVQSNALGAARPTVASASVGLPVPPAAGLLVGLVLGGPSPPTTMRLAESGVALLVLGALMVSRVRYRTFKTLKLTARTVGGSIILAIAIALIGFATNPGFALFVVFTAYGVSGVVESLWRCRRCRGNNSRPG